MATYIKDRLINRALLLQIGSRVLLVIKERTLAGKFLPGSTGSSKYSTTPMPLPFGALQKTVQNSMTVRNLIDSEEAVVFKSKAGKKWILLKGGYEQFRELAGKQTDHVTLTWTGQMIRDLKVKSVDVRSATVTIGFTDARSEEIADYHQNKGAGKAKITHKFLGLTGTEFNQLLDYISRLLVRRA